MSTLSHNCPPSWKLVQSFSVLNTILHTINQRWQLPNRKALNGGCTHNFSHMFLPVPWNLTYDLDLWIWARQCHTETRSKVIWFKTCLDAQVHRETDTHIDTRNPFPGLPVWVSDRRKLRLDFKLQGKITDTPTIWIGATPSRLISNPLNHSPFLCQMPSCHNPPSLSWLGTSTKYAVLHTQWRGSQTDIRTKPSDWLLY